MKHLKLFEGFDNSSTWNEIEDILTPIKDDGRLLFKIQNFKYPTKNGSLSSILIRNWDIVNNRDRDKRYFEIKDIKDELNHLCSRFPDIISSILVFRSVAKNPTKYTPEEFIKESPVGNTFLVGINLKIIKDGAPYIPN